MNKKVAGSPSAQKQQVDNVIGRYLREKRQAAGLWQSDIAQQASVHTSTISRIENGELLPTVDVLVDIGIALDLDLSELLAKLGARTHGELPEFEDYLREKFGLPDNLIEHASVYFRGMTGNATHE